MSTSILIEKQAKGQMTFEYSTEDYLGCGTYSRVFKGACIENDRRNTAAAIKKMSCLEEMDTNRDAQR